MTAQPGHQAYYDAIAAQPELRHLDEGLQRRFARFAELIAQTNRTTNLTRIVEPAAVAKDHFADSVAALDACPPAREAQHAADIGAGAGFPVIPLAMMLPDCSWYAVDSVRKKCHFMEKAALKLELSNVMVEWMRAEEFARGAQRERCDLVTARAVGAVSSLCEVGLPLLRVGGALLMYKTTDVEPELKRAEGAIRVLGGEIAKEHRYAFEGDQKQRVIFVIRKTGSTPAEYPRATGLPFKSPL